MAHCITTIGFDADDTLWHNENLFVEHHRRYAELLAEFHDAETVESTLYRTEMRNLELYGYGIKSFMLSSIETAIQLTEGAISAQELRRIIDFGQEMLRHPVELLEGVAETLPTLCQDYRLVLITKGDLRDQQRKIALSGLAACFEHVEVLSDKRPADYDRLLRRLDIPRDSFLMVGNSLKSDILPILGLGAHAAYIPYPITWAHECVDSSPVGCERFHELESIKQLPALLGSLNPA